MDLSIIDSEKVGFKRILSLMHSSPYNQIELRSMFVLFEIAIILFSLR